MFAVRSKALFGPNVATVKRNIVEYNHVQDRPISDEAGVVLIVYTPEKGMFYLNNMAFAAFTRSGRLDRDWHRQILILRCKMKSR